MARAVCQVLRRRLWRNGGDGEGKSPDSSLQSAGCEQAKQGLTQHISGYENQQASLQSPKKGVLG